jgi:uncharacterized protein YbbK (DUF523 family)
VRCRYDGKSGPDENVIALSKKEALIPVCPEQLGGMPTPRAPAEAEGSGEEVLSGKAKVINKNGEDVSSSFIKGAEEVLSIAKLFGIKEAILRQKSPSCGSGRIYDGSFTGRIVKGDGVTTALLKRSGIKVVSEENCDACH